MLEEARHHLGRGLSETQAAAVLEKQQELPHDVLRGGYGVPAPSGRSQALDVLPVHSEELLRGGHRRGEAWVDVPFEPSVLDVVSEQKGCSPEMVPSGTSDRSALEAALDVREIGGK